MAVRSLVLLLALTLACTVVVVLVIHLLTRTPLAQGSDDPELSQGLSGIRRRLLGCLGAAALVVIAGFVSNDLLPGRLGVPLALTPGLAVSIALLCFAMWPTSATPRPGPTQASLTRREPWSFGSPRSLLVPGVLALVYLGLLAAAATVASPDDHGLMRSFSQTQGDLGASASPFPGSFYGVPLALVTVVLEASTYGALHRVARSASLLPSANGRLAHIDRRWREVATRAIVRLSTAALLAYAGGTLVVAGSAIHRASDFTMNGGYRTPWSAVAWLLGGAGVAGILGAAVVGGAAVAAVVSLKDQAVRPPEIPTKAWR
jgi:hypothetical protein